MTNASDKDGPASQGRKILLFDLGGVLVENAIFQELPRLLREPVAETELYDRWLESEAVQMFERGELDEAQFGRRFAEEWRLAVEPEVFLEAFAGWPRGPYPGVIEMLARLRPRYRLAYLSNCNSLHWRRLEGMLGHVDHAFASHLFGVVKPDPEIFRRVLAELACEAGEICFFDDSLKNIRAAKAAGFEAHHTIGFTALERAIESLGLLAA